MATSFPILLLPLLLLGGVAVPGGHAFFPNFWSKFLSFTWGSYTHQDLTEEAVLNVTLRILLDNPHPTRPALRGRDFQDKILTADTLLLEYFGEGVSSRQFRDSLRQIVSSNANMDFLSGTRSDPLCHFDSESLMQGNRRLLDARRDFLEILKAGDYEGARERLGQILHSLQDFYSHTNWVELGHTEIHPDLATPGRDIAFIAGASDETCTDCSDLSCHNNIAENIQKRHLITSGYYGENPEKPEGKCSHGGPFDDSRQRSARGGINKDTAGAIFSPHHFLHHKAAKLALEASIKFLNELRKEVNDGEIMRLLGACGSTALSFVIDTTGSMGEEITTAKHQSLQIIQSRQPTPLCPDDYILVPFHDPTFGPVYKTTDPNEFLRYLNDLQALGGGDEPEMCLSALQLALIHTPPHSEIFVFTDASSKDAYLRSSVESLIQERKIKVSFLITEDNKKIRSRSRREGLPRDRFDLYSDLAVTSGGQVIFTTNEHIPDVSEIIVDSTHSDMITIFDLQSSERGDEVITFHIDNFMRYVSLYINGEVESFSIQDPKGRILNGNRHSWGKFTRISLPDPPAAGEWKIVMKTWGLHTVRVQGRSSVDFLYYFGVPINGSHPGLYKLGNQPVAGVSIILVVDVIGLPESAHLDHVTLTPANKQPLKVQLQFANQTGVMVAQVGQVPEGGFSIGVSGEDGNGMDIFREAPQRSTVVECMVEIINESPLTPGTLHPMMLQIKSYGMSHCYSISMSNDRTYRMNDTIPRLIVTPSSIQEAKFWIQVPDEAALNSVVSVSAQVTSCDGQKPSCFTLLPLIVTYRPEVSAYSSPTCSPMSYIGSCPLSLPRRLCHDHSWSSTLQVSDPYGVKSARVLSGSGSVSHRPDGTSQRVDYASDCCSTKAKIELTNYRGATGHCQITAPTTSYSMGLDPNRVLVFLLGVIPVLLSQ